MNTGDRRTLPGENSCRLTRDMPDLKGYCGRSEQDPESDDPAHKDILYSVDDVPPWYLSFVLGFQHYLLMLGSISMPLIASAALCIGDDEVGKSEVVSTAFFVSGLGTVIQSTLGTRLPIVQSNSPTFLPPIIALMLLPEWKCPDNPPEALLNDTEAIMDWRRGVWTLRMREIQGSMALASIAQILLGVTGIIGLLLPYIGPLVIAPSVALIGLSLFMIAADIASAHWGIAFLTIVLATVFSQYFRFLNVPLCRYQKGKGWSVYWYPLFKLLPIVLSIAIAWAFCAILTRYNVFPDDPTKYGYAARTDYKLEGLKNAKWFRFPYPGQWGMPTYSTAGVFAMVAAIIAGIIESIGDYYAAARLSGAPPPPIHAVNRGVAIEGVGIALAGVWGTSIGLTSYSENVGAIGITKVGSRRVIQVAGLCMIFFGMLGKFGALFVAIPDPILGGLFLVVFGMVTAVGVSNLQYVDLNSTRNLYIFGFSLLSGLSIPYWVTSHPGAISTGSQGLDQVITVLLSTTMFVGGFIGFILDNTVPGSQKERGILAWRETADTSDPNLNEKLSRAYDLPFIMRWVRRWRWTRYVPICPTFDPPRCELSGCCDRRRKQEADTTTTIGAINNGYMEEKNTFTKL